MSSHSTLRPHVLDKEMECLSVSWLADHVVVVALNRPQKRNAMNRIMWKEIGRVFSSLGRLGDGCRCVLLMGNGNSFSAGIDVTDASLMPGAPDDDNDVARVGLTFQPQIKDMQDCFTALEKCPVPVVAAVHGACIGAGMDLITAADVRICTRDAIFSVREVALGLAADVGTLQRLPKIVGNQSWVRELCLTGRNVSAEEALNMGLVSRVVDDLTVLMQTAVQLCSWMARHSPIAVQGTKRALLYARDHSVRDGLDQVASFNALALQSNDLPIAFSASKSEPPVFPDIPAHSRL